MSKPIEDYGFIGNMLSCALVARDGSIDWLCLPRFDSDACFAALLGTRTMAAGASRRPASTRVSRSYRDGTTILETTFETADGAVTLIDFMPLGDDEEHVDLMRLVRGDRGTVAMRMEFVLRFGYGTAVPWVRRRDFGLSAVAGPDGVELHTDVPLDNENMRTTAEFVVARRRDGAVHALLPPVATARASARSIRRPPRRDRGLVARLVGPLPVQRRRRPPLVRGRRALAGDAEGPDLRADRRHRGGGDHVAARARSAASATGTTATAGSATRR